MACCARVPISHSHSSAKAFAECLLACLSSWHWPQVMEVQSDVRLCTVTEGLTEDAVSARLVQGEPSLYLQPILPTLKQWLSHLPSSMNVPRVSSIDQAYLSIGLGACSLLQTLCSVLKLALCSAAAGYPALRHTATPQARAASGAGADSPGPLPCQQTP